VLLFSIRFTTTPLGTRAPPVPRALNIETVSGMRVLDIVPVAANVPTPQVVVEPRAIAPVRTDLAVRAPVDASPAAATTAPADTRPDVPATVADRLAPRAADPRLWANAPDPLRPELEPLNNVRARVYSALSAYNDSIAAAAAAAQNALDWTVRDKNGGRWGVSPTGIHLGTVTLPLPSLGMSAEQRAASRVWNETQHQASRRQVEQNFDDRVRAIRARKDAARDSARRGGGR
jgi:hypothetical protein